MKRVVTALAIVLALVGLMGCEHKYQPKTEAEKAIVAEFEATGKVEVTNIEALPTDVNADGLKTERYRTALKALDGTDRETTMTILVDPASHQIIGDE